jgi:hypothetical protein
VWDGLDIRMHKYSEVSGTGKVNTQNGNGNARFAGIYFDCADAEPGSRATDIRPKTNALTYIDNR